jgi:hypothetical protein
MGRTWLRPLAEHGAELDRPGGETWRDDVPLCTAYPRRRSRCRGGPRGERPESRCRTSPTDPQGGAGPVGADFAGVLGGSPEGSLLHHAAWVGDAALVTRLLTREPTRKNRPRPVLRRPGRPTARRPTLSRAATTSPWPSPSAGPATRSTPSSSRWPRVRPTSGSRSAPSET